MPQYTLTYFDSRGRAEPIRLLFQFAGIPFEDQGVAREAVPAALAAAPLGQMPYLTERDGDTVKVLPQSMAILRHLARTHGLYGASEAEHLVVDIAAETAVDARDAFYRLRFSPGWTDDAARAKFAAETAPVQLRRLDKLLADRAFFAGEAPTYADFVAFDVIERYLLTWPALAEPWPRLATFVARVTALPTLASYLATRRPA